MPAAFNPVDISNQVVFLELEHSDVNWACFTLKLHVLDNLALGREMLSYLLWRCGIGRSRIRQATRHNKDTGNQQGLHKSKSSVKNREEPYGAQLDLATV